MHERLLWGIGGSPYLPSMAKVPPAPNVGDGFASATPSIMVQAFRF